MKEWQSSIHSPISSRQHLQLLMCLKTHCPNTIGIEFAEPPHGINTHQYTIFLNAKSRAIKRTKLLDLGSCSNCVKGHLGSVRYLNKPKLEQILKLLNKSLVASISLYSIKKKKKSCLGLAHDWLDKSLFEINLSNKQPKLVHILKLISFQTKFEQNTTQPNSTSCSPNKNIVGSLISKSS